MKNNEVTKYLRDIARIGRQAEFTPELSLRERLLRLARIVAAEAGRRNLLIVPEARAGEAGQPDIFIKDGPRLVGFIETKPPDTDLPRVLRSERQLKRYRQLLPNWILTDYYRFLIIREGEISRRFEIEEDNPEPLVTGFVDLLSYAAPVLRSPRRLAQELARRARLLRDALEMLVNNEPTDGNLRNVLSFYRQTLMDDLDEASFADTLAQTIVYGLFLGRLRQIEGHFSRRSATNAIPQSIPFLRSAVRLLTDYELLPESINHLLDDLVALLDNTDTRQIRQEIAARELERDLGVYFYEHFLEQYDAGERMNRGVYYTPPELLRYLIRATHEVLMQDFRLSRGLADSRVTLLDPAAGTGTFVLGAAEQALSVEQSRGTASQRRLVWEHLLQNFYGFELLPAPYAVAHLKLMSFYEQAGRVANLPMCWILKKNLLPARSSNR